MSLFYLWLYVRLWVGKCLDRVIVFKLGGLGFKWLLSCGFGHMELVVQGGVLWCRRCCNLVF